MHAKKWVLVRHFDGEPKPEDMELVDEELHELKEGGKYLPRLYIMI